MKLVDNPPFVFYKTIILNEKCGDTNMTEYDFKDYSIQQAEENLKLALLLYREALIRSVVQDNLAQG
jgi:hypothetical protein